jgi:hypothetical protein
VEEEQSRVHGLLAYRLGDVLSFGIRAQKVPFLSIVGKGSFTMPHRRRDRQTPDPPKEREMSRRRGRKMPDPSLEIEMRELRARLEDMETTHRRTTGAGDISDFESENEARHDEEEVIAEDAVTECFLKAVAIMGARAKMDLLVYEGNLDVEELLD